LKDRDGKYTLNLRGVRLWQQAERGESAPQLVKQERNVVFVVKMPDAYHAPFQKMKNVAAAYPGGIQLYMNIAGKYYLFEQTVADSDAFLAELYGIFGPDRVEVKERKK